MIPGAQYPATNLQCIELNVGISVGQSFDHRSHGLLRTISRQQSATGLWVNLDETEKSKLATYPDSSEPTLSQTS